MKPGARTDQRIVVSGKFRIIRGVEKSGSHSHAAVRASGNAKMWNQVYNPLGNATLSTIVAVLPVATLLLLIASNKVKAHIAAIIALAVANLVAIFIFTMPVGFSLRATALGAVIGFFPIGWIVLNVIFLYRLTVEKGAFQTLQSTIGGVTSDRRLQLLLIAFSFCAFPARRFGFGANRQHGAGGLRRARHAGRRSVVGDRHRSLSVGRHGRPSTAVFLADRAVLAD